MKWLINNKLLIALLALIAVTSYLSPNYFFTIKNFLNIFQQTAINAIMAIGMTIVILTAGIDLSVGALLALCGVLAVSMITTAIPLVVVVPAVLLIGLACGAITGVIVAKGRVQPFIATLIAMMLWRGATLIYTEGKPIAAGYTDTAITYGWFGTGHVFGIPVSILIVALIFIFMWYLLKYTRLGRYIYALGGNEEAARLSGINTDRIKIIAYSLSGLLTAVGAIIYTSKLASAQPTAGAGYELDAIAAAVLGGVSLKGGRGCIIGALIGALIMGLLNNILNILSVPSFYQPIVKASVILLAVLMENKDNKTN